MTDLYHEIFQGEIHQQSQCIWHENSTMDFFRSLLISMKYSSVDGSNKVWRRGDRTVVVCLVDDFSTCSTEYSTPLPYLFDKNTTVITDNWLGCPTQYQVFQLPATFFGIYHHIPNNDQWIPDRRFNFAVNRLDAKRLLLFLELQLRSANQPDIDLVNFNCWSWDGDNTTETGRQTSFRNQYQALENQYQQVYQSTFERLLGQMPFRNHQLDLETAHVSSWMNLVLETYSSDHTVALSEKIFRALCLPVPWMVYAGRHTVAYLRSLGFDAMEDIVSHNYDGMIENRTAAYGDKMVDFVYEGDETVRRLKSLEFDELQSRCQAAAIHNQRLLELMRYNWPSDFAQWLPSLIQHIR